MTAKADMTKGAGAVTERSVTGFDLSNPPLRHPVNRMLPPPQAEEEHVANAAGANPAEPPVETPRLHDYLGRKLDNASYLLGFARSIIEGLTGGLPPSDATLSEFKREYDAHFKLKHR